MKGKEIYPKRKLHTHYNLNTAYNMGNFLSSYATIRFSRILLLHGVSWQWVTVLFHRTDWCL